VGTSTQATPDFFVNGTIDEAIIYNRNLSSAEIQQLYFTSLRKHNESQWYLYVNQSLNSTDGLTDGVYTYQAFASDTSNNLNQTEQRTITIGTNAAPTITVVDSISAVTPNESGVNYTTFNFTATDTDGGGNINFSTAEARFQLSGETTRLNTTCINTTGHIGNNLNFTCTVGMYYFDKNDVNWIINVTVKDNSDAQGENSSTTFQYNLLKAIGIQPTSITFASISQGVTNTTSNNDPTLINNTGNFNITVGNIQINATNLIGETDSSEFIPVANFSLDIDNGGSPPLECSGGTTPVNNTATNITNAILPRGNHSANYGNATSAQEQIYYCITEVPTDISSQEYSTPAGWSWTIRILLAVVSIPRKKKKKLGKKKLTEAFDLIDVLDKKLKKRYGVGLDRLIDIKRRKTEEIREKIGIPLDIFKQEIGAAESLTKYLKENKELRLNEIAKLLNRDQRTIGTNYRNSIKKKKEKIELRGKQINIPIETFFDRRLSISESLVYYLKEKGLKNSEIAQLLEKDSRNVWTLYSRAKNKLNIEK